jgi:hypothetical protein
MARYRLDLKNKTDAQCRELARLYYDRARRAEAKLELSEKLLQATTDRLRFVEGLIRELHFTVNDGPDQ